MLSGRNWGSESHTYPDYIRENWFLIFLQLSKWQLHLWMHTDKIVPEIFPVFPQIKFFLNDRSQVPTKSWPWNWDLSTFFPVFSAQHSPLSCQSWEKLYKSPELSGTLRPVCSFLVSGIQAAMLYFYFCFLPRILLFVEHWLNKTEFCSVLFLWTRW